MADRKVSYSFKLSDILAGVRFKNARIKNRVIRDVSDVIVSEVLDKVAQGKSPVKGQRFDGLSPGYKKFKQSEGGQSIPNLELQGAMLASLKITRTNDVMQLHVSTSEEEKADGHNQHTSKAKSWAKRTGFPRRAFIPDDGEVFKDDIIRKAAKVIREGLEEDSG